MEILWLHTLSLGPSLKAKATTESISTPNQVEITYNQFVSLRMPTDIIPLTVLLSFTFYLSFNNDRLHDDQVKLEINRTHVQRQS